MKIKNETINEMEEVLEVAKTEIFDSKSTMVKNHFQSLLGKADGIRVTLAKTVKSEESRLAEVENEIARLSGLTVHEAYLEILEKSNAIRYNGLAMGNCGTVSNF